MGIGFTQVSALFANFPELIQSVFAQNCVAVVFLVAVVANLVLPKDAGIEGATAMSRTSTAEAAPERRRGRRPGDGVTPRGCLGACGRGCS